MNKQTAHYHLPGLFEFYEFYKVFLSLFYEHREYFYDWCDIGSIYGAPADCIWGGGRAGFGDGEAEKVFSLMAQYGISARLTFSNSLIRKEHLADVKCNKLCELLKAASKLHSDYKVTSEYASKDYSIDNSIRDTAFKNGIIVHSDILLDYLKNKYPELFVIADISTVEEGIRASKAGVDAVGTTLSGYTPYSKNPIIFGTVPSPDPDYEIIKELKTAGVSRVIAEGRINDGSKMKKCIEAGAFAVVIGTSISEPAKIVKTILHDAKEG